MSDETIRYWYWIYACLSCGSSIRRHREEPTADPTWAQMKCPYDGGTLMPFMPAEVPK